MSPKFHSRQKIETRSDKSHPGIWNLAVADDPGKQSPIRLHRAAFEETAACRNTGVLSILHQHAPVDDDNFRHTLHSHTLVEVVVHVHVVGLCADHRLGIRVKHDYVRVAPHCDGALSGEKAEQLGRSRREQLHQPVQVHQP